MRIDKNKIRMEQARLLHKNGMPIWSVAKETSLPIDTVQEICQEITPALIDENLHIRMGNQEACSFCGHPLIQPSGSGRPRRFCSDHCRRQYWRLHRSELKKNLTYVRVCRYCGKPFQSYGKAERKYCCRDHYLRHLHGENYCRRSEKQNVS